MEKELIDHKEFIDYKHKLKMKELKFEREANRKRNEDILNLEKQKHEWKLEEGRIWFAEQRKLQASKERANAFRRT